MKYLISITLLCPMSCSRTTSPYIIGSVASFESNICIYSVIRDDINESSFQDSCGKYQVGDTLIFVKK